MAAQGRIKEMRSLQILMVFGCLAGSFLAAPAIGGITVVSTNFGLEKHEALFGITPESDGKLLINGSFTLVNGIFCPGAARLYPDGSLDTAWRPMPGGTVIKILTAADGIYLAGDFEHIGGTPRFGLAKTHPATGALVAQFNPNPNAPVFDIAMHGSALYAGGEFTHIGGKDRPLVAKLNPSTGAATPAFTNGPEFIQIAAMALDETGLYLGGFFWEIGGEQRLYVAKVSTNSGDAIPNTFTNGADQAIFRLRIAGNYLYACGYFESIGNENRNSFARLNRMTGKTDTNFQSGINDLADGLVMDCAITGSAVFVCGDFTNYGGTSKAFIAKVNAANGAVIPAFTAQLDNAVSGLAALPNGKIAAAGAFTQANGRPARGIAIFDPITGARDQNFSARVADGGICHAALQLADGSWIIGGDFQMIHGTNAPYLAKFLPNGALDVNWTPRSDGPIQALTSDGSALYVGGSFNKIGGRNQTNIAKLRLSNGAADSAFTAQASQEIKSLALSGNTLYVGGSFTNINGQPRARLAKLDKNTGAVNPDFTANVNNYVSEIALDGGYLYACGSFTQINGTACGYIARVNVTSGAPDTVWNTNAEADDRISGLDVTPTAIFAGGDFNNIGGQPRICAAKLNKSSGHADPNWTTGDTNNTAYIFAIRAHGDYVYVGGSFNQIGGRAFTNAARLSLQNGALDQNWQPMPDSTVYDFQFQGPYIFMFGCFLHAAGIQQQGVTALTHNRPQVSITEPGPESNHWFQSLATIELEAQAQADTGMVITQVMYYANGHPIGAATTSPYTFIWTPVAEGQYTIKAVACDQWGITGESASMAISVTPYPLAADFDGDGKADPALHVIPPGAIVASWYVWLSGNGYRRVGPVLPGELFAVPLAGDLDGDGKADPTLWWTDYLSGDLRNVWYPRLSTQGYLPIGPVYLGPAGTTPVLADFDGDGKADLGVSRDDSTHNIWRVWCSSADYADSGDLRFGTLSPGMPLAADFDGDGKADLAKVHQNQWRIWLSSAGYQFHGPYTFAAPSGGIPLAADFDGDGKADPAIYVPIGMSNANGWYIWLSASGYIRHGPYPFLAP